MIKKINLRYFLIAISALAVLAIPVFYNNCGIVEFSKVQNGTILGNPMNPTAASSEILTSVCTVLNRCGAQVPVEICTNGVLATSGIGVQLGLAPGVDDPYTAIENAESSGQITANPVATDACTDTINNYQCDNPNVINAYNPLNQNPFSAVPSMVPAQACNHTFTPPPVGTSLEVPIELVDMPVSSNIMPVTFSRSRTTLNTGDYDGIVTYTFEIVALNNDSSPKNVSLMDSFGIVDAVISIPVGTANNTRVSTTFVPTSGASDYRVQVDGTTAANQVVVSEVRTLVRQIGATQTKIYVPLVGANGQGYSNADNGSAATDGNNSNSYNQQNPTSYAIWNKNDSAFSQLAAGNPWTFEAVLSDSGGGTSYASLFDASTGLQVTASEVSTTSLTPALVSLNFSDTAANFTNLDNMDVQIKKSGGGLGYVYRSGLWIKLQNLAHAEVYYRYMTATNWIVGAGAGGMPFQRALPDLALFSSPVSTYNELTSLVEGGAASCQESLYDAGVEDSGYTGSVITGSTLNVSSASSIRQRSGALNLIPGDRYIYYFTANPGPGNCMGKAFLVLGF